MLAMTAQMEVSVVFFSEVFFALLTCLHVQFQKIVAFILNWAASSIVKLAREKMRIHYKHDWQIINGLKGIVKSLNYYSI